MASNITDRLNGFTQSAAFKSPVKAATTANITLSGTQTIDGVAVVADDRVLVKDQTDTTENGIYVASTGAWSRAPDFNGERDVLTGTLMWVTNGSTYADTMWRVSTSGDPSPGEAMAFTQVQTAGADGTGVTVTVNETADTYLDGVDFTAGTTTQLTLSQTPSSENDTFIFFDGVYQGKTTYSIAGAVVTFDAAIPTGVGKVEAMTSAGQSDLETLIAASADIQLLADIQDGTTATNAITDVAAIDTDVTTVANRDADIVIVAARDSDIGTLADVEDGTVSTNALSNLGPISADITTVAGSITSVQQAAEALTNALQWTFQSSTTMADPSAGNIRLNNATLSSVTSIALSKDTAQSQDVLARLLTWDDSTNTTKGTLRLVQGDDATDFVDFDVTAVTDNTTWVEVTVTHVTSAGTFTASDTLYVTFDRAGDQGGGLAAVVDDTTPQLGGDLDPNGNYIGRDKGGDIASASPLVIDTDGDYFDVTGTTDFAAMTVAANRNFTLQFDGALTITHGSGITLPGAANYTTSAGDILHCQSTAADTVVVTGITKADGTAVVGGGGDYLPNSGYDSARYYYGAGFGANSGTNAHSAGQMYCKPYLVGNGATFTRVGVEVTATHASSIRIGLYTWVDGAPVTLITDFGTVSASTTGVKEITISEALDPGIYGLAVLFEGAPTMRRNNISSTNDMAEFFTGSTSTTIGTQVVPLANSVAWGALPSTFPTIAGYQAPTGSPACWFRKV